MLRTYDDISVLRHLGLDLGMILYFILLPISTYY